MCNHAFVYIARFWRPAATRWQYSAMTLLQAEGGFVDGIIYSSREITLRLMLAGRYAL